MCMCVRAHTHTHTHTHTHRHTHTYMNVCTSIHAHTHTNIIHTFTACSLFLHNLSSIQCMADHCKHPAPFNSILHGLYAANINTRNAQNRLTSSLHLTKAKECNSYFLMEHCQNLAPTLVTGDTWMVVLLSTTNLCLGGNQVRLNK